MGTSNSVCHSHAELLEPLFPHLSESWTLTKVWWVHWRRKWQPTPVLLPGESQGRWGLVGCLLWGRTESDTTDTT